jgi:hypothetical protein
MIAMPKVRHNVGIDQAVNTVHRNWSLTHLKRDLPSRNRTAACERIVNSLPGKLRAKLGDDVLRPPYVAHAALAAIDAFEIGDDYRGNARMLTPQLSREQTQAAIEWYGPADVQQCIRWLARELEARTLCYGTKGCYLREHFMSQCAHYREMLNSLYQAPDDWPEITSLLIQAGALQARYYHQAHGYNYPSFTFVGSHSASKGGRSADC